MLPGGARLLAILLASLVLAPGASAAALLDLPQSPAGEALGGVAGTLPVTGALALVDPRLAPLLADGRSELVILVLEPALVAQVSRALEALGLDFYLYDRLAMIAVPLDGATLPLVRAVPGVRSVHPNEVMAPLLDHSVGYIGARVVADTYGVTGRGVGVLVVDSGVDGTHPDVRFKSNLVENVVPARQSNGLVSGSRGGVASSDPDGHGTHVAGIIGGLGKALGDDGKFHGVAPGARLVGFQAGITDPDSGEVSFESLTVLEAFNWALANRAKYNLRVVSNSWGANGDFDARSPINIATLNLYKAGLVVVFAAGNEGTDGSHSLNKYSVAPWVLSVTVGDYVNSLPKFASRGTDPDGSHLAYDHPDLVAPGISITSARAGASTGGSSNREQRYYSSKSGSSMAAPHVAGIAALLLEVNPNLSPDDVMDILTATATPMPRYDTWEAGAGYANALQAQQLAKRAMGHRGEFLAGKVKYAGPASGDPRYERDAVSVGYGRGSAYHLRSPDKSFVEFTVGLFTTIPGLVFLAGTASLGTLAFARNADAARRARRAFRDAAIPAAERQPALAVLRPRWAYVGPPIHLLSAPQPAPLMAFPIPAASSVASATLRRARAVRDGAPKRIALATKAGARPPRAAGSSGPGLRQQGPMGPGQGRSH